MHDLCFLPFPLTSKQATGNHFFEFFGTQTIFARVAVPPGEKVTFSQNTFYLRCPVSYVYFLRQVVTCWKYPLANSIFLLLQYVAPERN